MKPFFRIGEVVRLALFETEARVYMIRPREDKSGWHYAVWLDAELPPNAVVSRLAGLRGTTEMWVAEHELQPTGLVFPHTLDLGPLEPKPVSDVPLPDDEIRCGIICSEGAPRHMLATVARDLVEGARNLFNITSSEWHVWEDLETALDREVDIEMVLRPHEPLTELWPILRGRQRFRLAHDDPWSPSYEWNFADDPLPLFGVKAVRFARLWLLPYRSPDAQLSAVNLN